MKPTSAALLAAAVASMFASGCGVGATTGSTQQAVVKCQGVNDCKGQGDCGGVHLDGGLHGCQGENDCKGRAWIELPASECETRGGSRVR